mmetsp:Transcript_13870/g.44428  ORF Transcript_13870/g.44428 Transcript_13870/m.44428 type:complete len:203 (-) Transcript_13870:28-636(-)
MKERRESLVKVGPRVFGGGHLDHGAPDAPDVRLASMARLPDHLGRHPVHRPTQSLQRLVQRLCHQALQLLGAPKVCQFGCALFVDKHVGSFDIPVHDAAAVQERDPRHDLPRVPPDHSLRQRSELPHHGRHRPAGHVLHEDVHVRAVRAHVCAQVAHDVRVVQRAHHGDLRHQVRRHVAARVGGGQGPGTRARVGAAACAHC